MCEYHVTTYGGSAAVVRTLQTALEHIFATRRALEYLGTLKDEIGTGQSQAAKRENSEERELSEINFDEMKKLVQILESRLTNVLKELVKANTLSKNKSKSSKDWGGLEAAKRMYSAALRRSATSADEEIVEKCLRVAETLQNLEKIKSETRWYKLGCKQPRGRILLPWEKGLPVETNRSSKIPESLATVGQTRGCILMLYLETYK